MTFSHSVSSNNYGPAKFIVSALNYQGTHTTIASALTSASSGDTIFIRPGTYTENLTLKAGVNICSFGCEMGLNGVSNVNITGTLTLTGAGTVSIYGIRLTTNSANIISITGSAASIINLVNCYINCSNFTGISNASSSASSAINIYYCKGDLGTTGIALFSDSSAGDLYIFYCEINNSGNSLTNSTKSGSGRLLIHYTQIVHAITYSSSSPNSSFFYTHMQLAGLNITALTTSGTGTITLNQCSLSTGSAICMTAGSGTTIASRNQTNVTTNATAIDGAGSLTYSTLIYGSTGKTITTTTQTNTMSGTFTPTIDGTTPGTTTYNSQSGNYVLSNGSVKCWGIINIASATGTGSATIAGLPFTSKSSTALQGICRVNAAGWAWPVGRTTTDLLVAASGSTATITCYGTSVASANLQMTNAAAIFIFYVEYFI